MLVKISAGNTTQQRGNSPRGFSVEDNFLTQLMMEPAREGILLDLLFVNREGLVGSVMVGGCVEHGIDRVLICW